MSLINRKTKIFSVSFMVLLLTFNFVSCPNVSVEVKQSETKEKTEDTGKDKTGDKDTGKTEDSSGSSSQESSSPKEDEQQPTQGDTTPTEDTVQNYAEYNLADNIEDGAILHAFCWNFNTIKNNLQNIADAGFTAVQTSPVSKCRAGGKNNSTNPGSIANWYYHYQPTEYVIGNYQLGTEAEFKAMCTEAHKLGIKIIVDAVMNHCTASYDYISDNIKALAGSEDPKEVLFHDMTEGQWTDDRYNATQKHLSNLWEWKTQSKVVQNYLLDFLKACVKDGADGFRYDAARHIELPDDDAYSNKGISFQSDFWPTILQNGATFQYGEILQDGYSDTFASGYDDNKRSGTRIGAYQSQTFGEENFRTTASHYGARVRSAIKNQNLSVAFLSDFLMPKGAKERLTVTWVESHDNYYNDKSYEELVTEQDAILGYALIAARANGTPLFFDRPNGASSTNHFGSQNIGNAGSSMYKDSQVRALNFFRNKMAGSKELLSNPTDSDKVLLIQRSAGGFVIVNLLSSDATISSAPCEMIADGTYKDEVSGNTFTVKNGKLSGKAKANAVTVVFAQSSGNTVSQKVTIAKNAYSDWENFYCYLYDDSGASVVQNKAWPGEKMTDDGTGNFSYNIPANLQKGCHVIFNNNSGTQSADFYLKEGECAVLDSNKNWTIKEVVRERS